MPSHRLLRGPALRVAAGLLALGAMTGIAACAPSGSNAGSDAAGKISVVAGFYPLRFVTERVGGDPVAVTSLTEPGAEPHDLELSPRQVAEVADARLVVYLDGFQPEVDETVARQAPDRSFDAATVSTLAPGADRHLWLDPTWMATVADRLAERLGQLDPDHAADYRARAAELGGDLEALDREYAEGLSTCQRREIVVSHAAFGYLAARYQLTQIAVAGLTPESEPTPQRLAAAAEQARAHQATTIFFETLVSDDVAEAIAREVGARTAVLDPIEGLPAGSTEDYLGVMRANLATLRTALDCT